MTLTTEDPTEQPPTAVRTEPVDATPLPVRSADSARVTVSTVLFAGVALVAWVLAYVFLFSGFDERHAQRELYGQLREQLALGTAPTAAPIAVGAPVALLDAPALGVRQTVVVQGTTPAQLQRGPGHEVDTVLPGQAGVAVLMGRSLSYGGVFRHVTDLHAGDTIDVTTSQGPFHYVVADVRRDGDPRPSVGAGEGWLTLVSSYGGSPLSAGQTVYADAKLRGKPQPAGAVSPADPGGAPMARDHGVTTLALLGLALEVLVLGLVGIVWARHRWSGLAAWITGLPVVLAGLWLVTTVATHLLPNLL